uniref:putative leucine-rich repeat-containing protein DDB_G0290503 n=1 Tax=Semicossyphus pulcher TaxID=241346 RepID=UPI0037E77C97
MFRSSSPFSLADLDMWDTKSRFTAQTSAWCGMAAVSGTGFLSKVSSSTSGSSGGFRQSDPGLRKWQSLSHLEPEGATRPFPPSPGAELRAARGDCSFRQADAGQWILDAHEQLDTLDRLRNRNSQLSYNKTTAQLLDMKHKEKEAAEFSQFEISRQRGELHEKVLQLEKELLQMRCALGRGSNDHPTEKTPGSLSRTLPLSQEDLNKQESQKVDTELHKLREALREAEARAKTQEEERNQAIQKLRTSTETQRTLLNQMEEMNQKLSHTRQNQSEVQEQLSEANNKISQACLEKAILSTQVLKLEDNIKELKTKLAGDLSDKDQLIQEKADLQQTNQALELQLQRAQQVSDSCKNTESQNNKQDQETMRMREELKALQEANEKLTWELKVTKQKLTTSQSQRQEMTAERDVNSKQITDLTTELSQLVREKDELSSKMNEGRHEELKEMKEKCCQLRESVEVLESEKLKMQDRCLCLEAEVLEKEEKLLLQEEEHRKQEAVRVQVIKDLRAVASHWTEKWQKVALTLQVTQEELEELRKNNFRNGLQTEAAHLASELETLTTQGQKNKKETESLQQNKLEACEQEQELERSRSQGLLHRYKCGRAVQTQDAEAETDLSESSLLWEPPSDSQSSPNKHPKVKDDKSSVEGRKEKTVCAVNPETDQQRRLVTEQLKSLFKEREGKEMLTVDSSSAAAQTGASSPQDRSNTSKVIRKAVERRVWQQGSGLMPVFEEDEEGMPTISHSSEGIDLQKKRPPSLYPDGIFQAELVDIWSPDEDEEDK